MLCAAEFIYVLNFLFIYCLWTDFVNAIISQPCNMKSGHFTGVWLGSEWKQRVKMGIVPCNNVFMSHNMNMLTDVTAGVICLQRGLQLSQLLPVKFRDCILHDCDASRWSHIGVICHYNRCPGAHFAMMTTRTDEVKTLPADAVADVKNGRD